MPNSTCAGFWYNIPIMKWTKSLIQTLRENPGDAEIDSHRLLMRAGLARKVAGGLYAYLPLGMRSLKKIMEIVREEMDRAGALEIVSPILQPAELWRTTGRWDTMGPNMFKLRRARVRARPHRRGSLHRPCEIARQLLSPASRHDLPDPVEVPRRDAPEVRAHALQGISHEGRLLLRHGCRGR